MDLFDRYVTGPTAVLPLDLRTHEEIAADDHREQESLRETLTGLPARPGVVR